MADGYVGLSPDSTGKKADTVELTVNGNTVERQRITLGSPTDTSTGSGAEVMSTTIPTVTTAALIVKQAASGIGGDVSFTTLGLTAGAAATAGTTIPTTTGQRGALIDLPPGSSVTVYVSATVAASAAAAVLIAKTYYGNQTGQSAAEVQFSLGSGIAVWVTAYTAGPGVASLSTGTPTYRVI
jgi:hypothetical protein